MKEKEFDLDKEIGTLAGNARRRMANGEWGRVLLELTLKGGAVTNVRRLNEDLEEFGSKKRATK
jgi:hypothetical protein